MSRKFTKFPSNYVKASSSADYLNYDYDSYGTYGDYVDAQSASDLLRKQGYETQINHHVVRNGVENYEVLYWVR